MPRGKLYDLTGIVLRDGPRTILKVDDGGEWRLTPERVVMKHLGERVRISGIREGFDVLFVEKIAPPQERLSTSG